MNEQKDFVDLYYYNEFIPERKGPDYLCPKDNLAFVVESTFYRFTK